MKLGDFLEGAAFAISLGLIGCGPDAGVKAPPAPPPSVKTMGEYSLALGHGIADVLAGKAAPDFLTCANANTDLRSTAMSEKQRFAELGIDPTLVMIGLKVTLSANASPGDDADGAHPLAFLDARSLTGPNGSVAWVELAGQVTAMRMPLDDRAPIDRILPAIGTGLTGLIHGLADGCTAPLLTEADLDALPYEVQKDERDTIMVGMKTVKNAMPAACRAAARGTSWDVHVHHTDVVFRSATKMARVRARMHLEGGNPCVGPIEIEQLL